MTSYKPLLIPSYPRIGAGITSDVLYWQKLGFPFIQKEFGAVTDINFSPVEPYHFAASMSSKVQIFNPSSNEVYRTLSRPFEGCAYGCSFRQDGKLVVAGDEKGNVHLFDIASKTQLKCFKNTSQGGHSGPVRQCCFLRDDKHVASFSDDKLVGVWDIISNKRILNFNEHQDYIRAGGVSTTNRDIIFSGSYDHTVKMYDTRQPTSVWTVDHGSPVEALLVLPSSGIVISAGGVDIKVWNVVTGGCLISKMTHHHKTVTCLCLASEGRRFMSGSLDCHVKVFDVTTYQPVATLNYESQILSLGVSSDDGALAVGMADGSLAIQQRKKPIDNDCEPRKRKASYRYSLEAKAFQPTHNDIRVSEEKRPKGLATHDEHLRKFNSSLALDSALEEDRTKHKPEMVVAVLKELIARKAIRAAVAGKTPRNLCILLYFLQRHVNDVRFMRVLVDVANIVLDIYSPAATDSRSLRLAWKKLHSKLERGVGYMKQVMSLKGTMEILLAAGAATTSDGATDISNLTSSLSTGSESNVTKISFAE
uniref:U3 small nucleolar RNA-associated protein 15 homolog n=1 Tax=Strigamia maritima TaxID=126957 RepID=T1JFR7_STRMM